MVGDKKGRCVGTGGMTSASRSMEIFLEEKSSKYVNTVFVIKQ